MHLPDAYITGDYLLSHLFEAEIPEAAELVALKGVNVTTAELRAQFGIPRDCAISLKERNERPALNLDFWAMLPTGAIKSLHTSHPVSKEIYLVRDCQSEDAIRFICYAIHYPWDSISKQIYDVIIQVEHLRTEDRQLANLLSLKHSKMTIGRLLNRARNL